MKRWILLIGDLLMLILFAFIGQSEHKTFTTLGGTLKTAAPFMIAWGVVALIFGLYNMRHYETFAAMFKRTLPVWAIAIPAGLALRALFLGKGIKVPFLVVAMISTFVLLFVWRFLFTWLARWLNT
ncbi:DUF3054 domain-containing protein [Effusibacillus pohliae]|uniref:DUF3054 domain-containing protein n=1 Tax=Effusibacillus pohliae TaxID=232270 RepID=UPI0003789E17|nr:DUF3054 domain-containing protein [Effusibacillus pohliae]